MLVSTVITSIGLDSAVAGSAGLGGVDLSRSVFLAGAMLRTRVRANASGRPGPRVQTGDYRRSISQTNRKVASVAEAHVFTNSPQALRLEYGFTGVDAIGRSYAQPPYPHWRPATEGIGKFMADEARSQVRAAAARFAMARFRSRTIGGP